MSCRGRDDKTWGYLWRKCSHIYAISLCGRERELLEHCSPIALVYKSMSDVQEKLDQVVLSFSCRLYLPGQHALTGEINTGAVRNIPIQPSCKGYQRSSPMCETIVVNMTSLKAFTEPFGK